MLRKLSTFIKFMTAIEYIILFPFNQTHTYLHLHKHIQKNKIKGEKKMLNIKKLGCSIEKRFATTTAASAPIKYNKNGNSSSS